MPAKEAEPLHYSLIGRLSNPPIFLAGSTVNCVVELKNVDEFQSEAAWSIVGLVGWVIGQFKLDHSALLKQNLTVPEGLTFEQMETQEANSLWFDCKSLFTTTLGSDAHVFYCGPMKFLPDLPPTGNEVTIRLSAALPVHLPPSVRGRLFKAAYKVLVGVQLRQTNSSTRPARLAMNTHALQLPFRLLPAPTMYHSLRGPDWPERDNQSNSTDHTTEALRPREQWALSGLANNPFWSNDIGTMNGTTAHTSWSDSTNNQSGGHKTPPHNWSVINAGQLRSALCVATRSGTRANMGTANRSDSAGPRSLFDPFGSTDRSDLESEQSTLGFSRPSSGTQPATFVISCAQGLVGRLCLLRTLFRMEDVVRGYFDFTDAQVPCLSCHVSLQCEERYVQPAVMSPDGETLLSHTTLFTSLPLNEVGEPEKLSFKLDPDDARISTWTEAELACLSKRVLPFTLPIPPNVSPQFCAHNPSVTVDFRWRLRLEFILAPGTSWEALGGGGPTTCPSNQSDVWNLPSYVKTDKLSWNLPIQLVCSDPSVICSPSTDCAQHATLLPSR